MEASYYSLNQFLQEQFHEKVYKLALEGGRTCPNRDGTAGTGGCIFCGEGSGSFAAQSIDEAIAKLQNKHTGQRYIAYFQSFTCTYRMSAQLIRRMMEAAEDERVAAVSLGTRPDCLDQEAMDVIRCLQKTKPVWVELGLQSIHEKSALAINRGYPLHVFEEAVEKLRALSVEIIVHLILGLPGESREEMLQSVEYLNQQDVQGVKLQLLHVLKGTVLGERFLSGELPGDSMTFPFTLTEYADLICDCLRRLRPEIVVHRITGDAPKKDLLAPLWSGDKKRVLNRINQTLKEQKINQGDMISDGSKQYSKIEKGRRADDQSRGILDL